MPTNTCQSGGKKVILKKWNSGPNSPKLRMVWFWTLFLGPDPHESKSKCHLPCKATGKQV